MTDLPEPAQVSIDGTTVRAVAFGDGPVTVVFENGLGTPLEEWALVAPEVARRARVVLYDRRRSRGKRLMADMVDDLDALLRAPAVKGPLVLVGHSYGGLIVRAFAQRRHEDVAGLVLVDATFETMELGKLQSVLMGVAQAVLGALARFRLTRRVILRGPLVAETLPADVRNRVAAVIADPESWRATRAEAAGLRESIAWFRAECPTPPSVPTRILSAGRGPKKMRARANAAHAALAAATEGAVLTVVADSGHYLCIDEPQTVIEAIDDVIGSDKRRGA